MTLADQARIDVLLTSVYERMGVGHCVQYIRSYAASYDPAITVSQSPGAVPHTWGVVTWSRKGERCTHGHLFTRPAGAFDHGERAILAGIRAETA